LADYEGSEFAGLRLAAGLSLPEAAEYLELPLEEIVRMEGGGAISAAVRQVLSIAARYPDPTQSGPTNGAFRFIDLFAGIGGIRLPFSELGGECAFSSEWDRFAQKTYERNFGELPHGDITAIKSADIPDHDLLLAGFPCQAFSRAGFRKGFADTRGTMFFEIQRILAARRPKAFLLENVKQLRGHDGGNTLRTIIDILSGDHSNAVPSEIPMSADARRSLSVKLNYETTFEVLKATDFGVPQKRERIYIVGFDRTEFPGINLRSFFDDLVRSDKPTRLGDALQTDAEVDKKYTLTDRLYSGLVARMERHRTNGNGFGHKVFGREDAYCNTITSRYHKDGREILIDQSALGLNPRRLTPRECARIQGFPDSFHIDAVSDTQAYRQFGNSVSVPVIAAIARAMADRLVAAETPQAKRASIG
jgi:DNA (cytosine-5)-methyltransferase 1